MRTIAVLVCCTVLVTVTGFADNKGKQIPPLKEVKRIDLASVLRGVPCFSGYVDRIAVAESGDWLAFTFGKHPVAPATGKCMQDEFLLVNDLALVHIPSETLVATTEFKRGWAGQALLTFEKGESQLLVSDGDEEILVLEVPSLVEKRRIRIEEIAGTKGESAGFGQFVLTADGKQLVGRYGIHNPPAKGFPKHSLATLRELRVMRAEWDGGGGLVSCRIGSELGSGLAVSAAGDVVAIGSGVPAGASANLLVLDLATCATVREWRFSYSTDEIQFTPDGKGLAHTFLYGPTKFQILDLANGKTIWEIRSSREGMGLDWSFDFSPSGEVLAIDSAIFPKGIVDAIVGLPGHVERYGVELWALSPQGKLRETILKKNEPPGIPSGGGSGVRFVRGGTWLVMKGSGRMVHVFEVSER